MVTFGQEKGDSFVLEGDSLAVLTRKGHERAF